ncbi:type VII secretion-associated serine protease mycosin [Micromonospora olivasterospora]|uniref:Type VII secretion-associated serine protease mycosin n=1 Tax=Micromonospora olivasterospora TaxID=1880 RepID=A0A562IBT2_MICOL|nr:S8 family serine peptidase [Micromonospora olivasterospora]TWH68362.1 type VII secretion-associated serine protease mycosin [Micromonospora olivasterospora]
MALLPAGHVSAVPRPEGFERIRGDQWHLRYLKVAEAHRISQGEGIVVAVPDTGVDPHPDLRNNLLPGKDIISGGHGNGQQDQNSHGTGMAGLIAAHGRKGGVGALGIAPKAKILPLYDTPKNGLGEADDLAASIEYAILQGVDVISVSATSSPTVPLQQAIKAALNANVVVVAGVGNWPREGAIGYPASHPGVIAVGGVDRAGNHAQVSVIGPGIDVVAPAVDIYSTSIDGKYRKGTGTSDAAAMVAGAAALIRANYPYLSAEEVAHRLTATAVDKGPPGRDDEYGYGVVDLVAALTADVPPLGFDAVATPPTEAAPPPGSQAGPVISTDGGRRARGRNSTTRQLVVLGVLAAGAGAYALIQRRRRRGDDPPPRISR